MRRPGRRIESPSCVRFKSANRILRGLQIVDQAVASLVVQEGLMFPFSFTKGQHQCFFFPNLLCPFKPQPQIISFELITPCDKTVALSFQKIWESRTLSNSRSCLFFNIDPSTFENDSTPRTSFTMLLRSVSCHGSTTLEDAGCCWLLLAAACWERKTEWAGTYFVLLGKQWWSQLSQVSILRSCERALLGQAAESSLRSATGVLSPSRI